MYLLDGYNILFTLDPTTAPFQKKRENFISYLQEKFEKLNLEGFLIFDGSHRSDEQSGRSYKSPLEIMYTPKGQNADSYIVECIDCQKNKKNITVVTNDAGLKRHARYRGAKVLSCENFFAFIEEKTKPRKAAKQSQENSYQIERLSKIFEKKLLDKDFD